MATISAQRFFALLDKSELLSEEELEDARRVHQGEQDAAKIARQLVSQGLLTQWQARKLQAGQHALYLGKYKLLERLAWGDTGRVYLAEHTQMHARVALKTLDRRHAENPDAVALFQKEGAIAAALDHPNIIHVRDFDCENNYYYLVMEYVEGEGLAARVARDRALPPEQAADYIAQAAAGLAHAHEQKVLHRDVQPVKLLLTQEGTVKILDLGAAELTKLNADRAPSSQPFAAPEVLEDSNAATEQSDLYSLGATFYYLLSGQTPPDAQKRARGPSARLRYHSTTPGALSQICDKMMHLDPQQRYKSASEVAEALQAWLSQQQRHQSPPPLREKSRSERPVLKTREGVATVLTPAVAKPPANEFDFGAPTGPLARGRGAAAPRSVSRPETTSSGSAIGDKAEEPALPWWKNRKNAAVAIGGGAAALVAVGLLIWWLTASPSEQPIAKKTGGAAAKATAEDDNAAAPRADAADADAEKEEPKEIATDFGFKPNEPMADDAGTDPAAADAGAADPAAAVAATPNITEGGPPAEQPAPEAEKTKPAAPAKSKTTAKLHPLEVVEIKGPSDVQFAKLADGASWLATGENPADATYEIIAITETPNISGIVLHALAHQSLPKGGPGRAPSGDIRLARAELFASGSEIFISSDEVKLADAQADASAKGTAAPNVLVSEVKKNWSTAAPGQNHWIALRAEAPIERSGKTFIKLRLEHVGPAALGRFRLAAITGDGPLPASELKLPKNSPPIWNPFADLAKAVSIPALQGTAPASPVPLGKLKKDFAVSVSLIGGTAVSTQQSFSLVSGSAAGVWDFLLHASGDGTGAGTPVARLQRDGEQLSFQWTEAASAQPQAGLLRNCLLQFHGSGRRHHTALRESVAVEGLPLNLERGRSSVRAEVPNLPAPEKVRLEFVLPEGFPPSTIEPSGPLPIDDTTAWIHVGQAEKLIHLKVVVKTNSRGIELTMVPHFQLDPKMKPQQLTSANLRDFELFMQGGMQQISMRLHQLEQFAKTDEGKQRKAVLEQQQAALAQQQLEATAAMEKLGQLRALTTALGGMGHVPYRIIYQIDEVSLELAHSIPPQAAP